MSTMRDAILTAVVAASCATTSEPMSVRFKNAPPVTAVDDRRNVPARPDENPPYNELDFYDRSFTGPIVRSLELPGHERALGVNALDEVPDSTWFTNRIGVRDLTPADIGRGPVTDEGPEPHKPWTVVSTKSGGTELGFAIKDARGIKYLIAFDDPARPELETGTAVVVGRLLWAIGYSVPADQIAYVTPNDLVLAPDAEIKDHLGHVTGHLDRAGLDRRLAKAWHTPDGRIRVFASRYLVGDSLGGTPPDGVREDDPNDRIPHQLRRDLRGQYPVFAWLDHVDLVQSNFLDMWVPDASEPSHHYVAHYLVDFGKSLGTMGLTDRYVSEGRAYSFDWKDLMSSLFTLGLLCRPWGHQFAPELTGVAPTFVIDNFDPAEWKPGIPYRPFEDADRFDMFWGAKLVGRLTREQIRAAVQAGNFTDPRAVDYLTETLLARQRATLAYWYEQVNPLDRFRVTANALCFDDLAIAANLASAAGTRYELASSDSASRSIGTVTIAASASGPTCTHEVLMSTAADTYTVVKITTVRPDFAGSTFVHLARAPSGEWRVVGVWRI